LTFEAPFHFGTGLRNGLIHRTVSRDAEGYLYVPGSSIKGALRERCEHLARLFNLQVHDPHDERSALIEFNPDPGIVDRIFGSRFRPGRLYFDDAHLVQEDKKYFDGIQEEKRYLDHQVQQRTQVSISRLTGAAQPGLLYTGEFGLRYLRFEGRIYGLLQGFEFPGTQHGTYSLLLLLAGLCSLERLGGSRSSGAGRLTCELTSLWVNGKEQDPRAWLEELEALEWYREEREGEKQ
jgi:CRISPR/Cas system CSM-associated protein Csm3 (group 7 of RAMP superfamily)